MKTKKHIQPKKDSNAITPDIQDQLLRVQAELDNFRKRTEQEKISLIKYANTNLISDILPVLDNFKRAATHAPHTSDPQMTNWIIGITAIEKQLEDVLKQVGMEEISVHAGDLFDHNRHEAISHDPSDAPENTVITIVESGYTLGDRILRPTKVRVSAGATQSSE